MLNMDIEPGLRAGLDAYIADYNAKHEHKATIRTTTEAALKSYLGPLGFWKSAPAAKKAGAR